jgi:TrmH family RNA methyltransferase
MGMLLFLGMNMLLPLKWYKELNSKKGRQKAGAFYVEGLRAIRQILSVCPDRILELVGVRELDYGFQKIPMRIITEAQYRSISATKTPQGIMAVVRLPLEAYSESLPEPAGEKILFLEDIQDSGNVGTLIRSAAAFDFSGIIMTEQCADPFSPKSVQASAGTVLSVWLRRTRNSVQMVKTLKKKGYTLAAMDLKGDKDVRIVSKKSPIIFALGNEASGLSASILELFDTHCCIPIYNQKAESLNVAACGAICMYLSV